MNIPFSPPDITAMEINEVVDTLKSGWITTGPKTKLFERKIAEYTNTSRAVCLNSATAAMELTLRLLGIGEGDEVITSAYTYTASASVIHHVGAKIVLVDTAKDSYQMDYEQLEKVITERTKAIIPVDIAGVMCDYDRIYEIVEKKRHFFKPRNEFQDKIGRVVVLADAAHSFGSTYKGRKSGEIADFTCFSFHAVKNLTTAEGGAVTWRDISGIDNEEI
ncbi:MAG TPA: DegT/DnrJ/EryC1/StrS aminotransferase family protein, partial [Hydrogenispora sp.]|nr:DegT/DnrJ/EryC1/StrS aminotransferase family protein [Hydrogenispora sp.]